jgi:hypothetical protein
MKTALYFQVAFGCLLLLLPGKFELMGLTIALHQAKLLPALVYTAMRLWVSTTPWVLIVGGIVALRGKRWGAMLSCVFDGLVSAAAVSVFLPLYMQSDRNPFIAVIMLGSAVVLLIAIPVFYFLSMSLMTSGRPASETL